MEKCLKSRQEEVGRWTVAICETQMTPLPWLMWQLDLRRKTSQERGWRWWPHCHCAPDRADSSASHPVSLYDCQQIQFLGGPHCLTQLLKKAGQEKGRAHEPELAKLSLRMREGGERHQTMAAKEQIG